MKPFQKSRDPRFALTTPQNPLADAANLAEILRATRPARTVPALLAQFAASRKPAAPAAVPAEVPADDTPPSAAPAAAQAPVADTPRSQTSRRYKPRPKQKPRSVRSAPSDDDPGLSPLERHARKCSICHHPERECLEEDFVNWRNADTLRTEYGINDYRSIYRHARITGLLEKRHENLRFAAETLIEHADEADPTPETILRAIRMCAHINDRGEWVQPATHVVVSSGGRITAPLQNPLPQVLASVPTLLRHAPLEIPAEDACALEPSGSAIAGPENDVRAVLIADSGIRK
ncbi:MAG: hypothetical protein WA192_06210 [Candidatus Acidiferrales bacterium]